MHLSIRAEILLAVAALGTSAATAQTELFFATGVDSTGWALAQSNADGHVLIESPQYPRGLWLHSAGKRWRRFYENAGRIGRDEWRCNSMQAPT